jgi:Tol biopolymer transport system component
MKRLLVLLVALVVTAMFAGSSESARLGRSAPRGRLLYLTPSGNLGVMDANGGRRRILNKLGDADGQLSPNHRLLGVINRTDTEIRLFVVKVGGRERHLIARDVRGWTWSPDSKWIAYSTFGPRFVSQMYVVRADGSGRRQLTHNTRVTSLKSFEPYNRPAWSPDGTKIAFLNWQNYKGFGLLMTGGRVFTIPISPGGHERAGPPLGAFAQVGPFVPYTLTWSPDGSALAVGGTRGVVIVRGSRVSWLQGSECCRGYDGQVLAWSPDGSRLAFLGPGAQSGGVAAVTRSFFTGLEGVSPVWSPDGSRLAFLGFKGLTITDRNGHHPVTVRTTADIASLVAWLP